MRTATRAALIGAVLILLATLHDTPGTRRAAVHHTAAQPPAPTAATTATPAPPLFDRYRPVDDHPHLAAWSLHAVPTGTVIAEHRCLGCTAPAASTIKTWLAGDALHRAGPHPTSRLLRDVDAAIVDSDNAAATRLHRAGGRDSLWRMVDTCGMIRTRPDPAWGATDITADDLARLGTCIATGAVAGPWTRHLLDRMRHVRGTGRFGSVDALPDADIATKNGWIINNGHYIVNCLAIISDGAGSSWSLAVLTRYPAHLGLRHGAQLCADVTRQLATPRPSLTRVRAE